MNNPQTPIEAAALAVDEFFDVHDEYGMLYIKDDNNSVDDVARAAILAFLQWFENEPESVARVIDPNIFLLLEEYGECDTSRARKAAAIHQAKAAIQFLQSKVK